MDRAGRLLGRGRGDVEGVAGRPRGGHRYLTQRVVSHQTRGDRGRGGGGGGVGTRIVSETIQWRRV